MDLPEDLKLAVHGWLAHDSDPVTRAEIESLLAAEDLDGLRARFDERLVFGTAGLRGPLGAGPNRMNRVVVRMAAEALVQHLLDGGTRRPTIVVGFDARRNSRIFARDTAAVIASMGGHAIALEGPLPTPVLAFAVRRLSADIQSVYVVPMERGAGLGGALVSALVAAANGLGIERVTVHSSTRAVSVYERAGFASSPKLLEQYLDAAVL